MTKRQKRLQKLREAATVTQIDDTKARETTPGSEEASGYLSPNPATFLFAIPSLIEPSAALGRFLVVAPFHISQFTFPDCFIRLKSATLSNLNFHLEFLLFPQLRGSSGLF
jgi:hypothetical protein